MIQSSKNRLREELTTLRRLTYDLARLLDNARATHIYERPTITDLRDAAKALEVQATRIKTMLDGGLLP